MNENVRNVFDPFAILDEARAQRQVNSITGGGGSALTVTDGTTTIDDVALLNIIGGVVSGTSPNATVTVTGGLIPPVVITSGATFGSPYDVKASDDTVLFDKTVGAASYALMPLAADMSGGIVVLLKDVKGDAATNVITISFSGGELCDGQHDVVIDNDYGWVRLAPLPGGGAWYQA